MNIHILVLVIAIALFGVLAFKQMSALILAPLVTIFVILCSGLPVLESLKGLFMPAATDYVTKYFLTFFVGALFGAVYQVHRRSRIYRQSDCRSLPRQVCCTNYHVYHRYPYFRWCQRFRCILRYLPNRPESFQRRQPDKKIDSCSYFSRMLDMVHVSTWFTIYPERYRYG